MSGFTPEAPPAFAPSTLVEQSKEWPRELDHISASSLSMAARCPEAWRRRYVVGDRKPPALAMVWGRSDHKAIEDSLRQRMDHGELLPDEEAVERFASYLDHEIESSGGINELTWDKGESKPERKKAVGQAKDKGTALVAGYHRGVAPRVIPTELEAQVEIAAPWLPHGLRIDGRIDLIASVESSTLLEQTEPRIVDRKLAGVKVPGPEWLLQAAIYQYAKPLPFEWHLSYRGQAKQGVDACEVLTSVQKPELWLPLEAKEQDRIETYIAQVVGMIGYYYASFGPDDPWPGAKYRGFMWNGHPCNFCGFRPDCPWWT